MKFVPEKNAVRILWGRERGTQALGAQRLLQELVEDKTRWMKWEGKVRSQHGGAQVGVGEGDGRQGFEDQIVSWLYIWCVTLDMLSGSVQFLQRCDCRYVPAAGSPYCPCGLQLKYDHVTLATLPALLAFSESWVARQSTLHLLAGV